jgi:hypothetical protein
MDFSIKFFTDLKQSFMMENPIGAPGLDLIDEIRKEINKPELSFSKIHIGSECKIERSYMYFSTDPCGGSFNLPNELVYRIPYFRGNNIIHVVIAENFFGKYVKMHTKIITEGERWKKYNKKTGVISALVKWTEDLLKNVNNDKIYKVNVSFSIDYEAVLAEWMEAVCPLFWGITEEEFLEAKKNEKKRSIESTGGGGPGDQY